MPVWLMCVFFAVFLVMYVTYGVLFLTDWRRRRAGERR
jgi:hypothetical protein